MDEQFTTTDQSKKESSQIVGGLSTNMMRNCTIIILSMVTDNCHPSVVLNRQGSSPRRPHPSRKARPRFFARANLMELMARGGKSDSTKSGRSLANDSSCSLFNKRLVCSTFSRGPSCQSISFNCRVVKL